MQKLQHKNASAQRQSTRTHRVVVTAASTHLLLGWGHAQSERTTDNHPDSTPTSTAQPQTTQDTYMTPPDHPTLNQSLLLGSPLPNNSCGLTQLLLGSPLPSNSCGPPQRLLGSPLLSSGCGPPQLLLGSPLLSSSCGPFHAVQLPTIGCGQPQPAPESPTPSNSCGLPQLLLGRPSTQHSPASRARVVNCIRKDRHSPLDDCEQTQPSIGSTCPRESSCCGPPQLLFGSPSTLTRPVCRAWEANHMQRDGNSLTRVAVTPFYPCLPNHGCGQPLSVTRTPVPFRVPLSDGINPTQEWYNSHNNGCSPPQLLHGNPITQHPSQMCP
jgi:hypothetical protein